MRNKRNKIILDEMQERNLLKLEETGFWIVFWSLFVAIVVQLIIKPDIKMIAGEAIALLIASIYIAYSSIKNGLWSKSTVPTRKQNAVTSMLPALLLGIIHVVRTFFVLKKAISPGVIITIGIRIAIVYILCFVVLEMMRIIYQKKRNKLDDSVDE